MLRESIAIVGGGYGGIGCAYSLRRSGSAFRGRVRLFDRALPLQQQQPPQPDHVDPTAGWSASSVSAGMIHPLSPSGKMLPLGEAAFAAARGSIRFALGGDNDKDDDDNDGASGCIAKVFATRTESDKFSKAVERHSQWVEDAPTAGGPMDLFRDYFGTVKMKGSIVIDSERYISSFWNAYRLEMGTAFEVWDGPVTELESLSTQHDAVVVAAGAGLVSLWGTPLPMVSFVKGQCLVYSDAPSPFPARWPWLRCALLPGGYVAWRGSKTDRSRGDMIIGATYEHGNSSIGDGRCSPDLMAAKDILLNKSRLGSGLSDDFKRTILNLTPSVRAAYRMTVVAPGGGQPRGGAGVGSSSSSTAEASPRGKTLGPVILRHPTLRNVFAVTGFASRGLLYHSLTGKYLIDALLHGDFSVIPQDMYIDTKCHYS